jgi:hypothetical protein
MLPIAKQKSQAMNLAFVFIHKLSSGKESRVAWTAYDASC